MNIINDIKIARQRIAPYIVQTPLIRLPSLDSFLGCRTFIKAENMQITGAFKIRGAMNKAVSLSPQERAAGLVCASSGNHGKALAYTAKLLGTKAAVVIPYSAPEIKVKAIEALGAEVIRSDLSERFAVAERICAERHATLVPPFNDPYVIAGQGTAGLEIAEQEPELDAVLVPVSGGGLLGGVSCALKNMLPGIKVYGAEPEALPRYSRSLHAGQITRVPQQRSLADALLSQEPGSLCFPLVQQYVDEVFPVSDEYLLKAMKLLLTEGKILAEPSSCIGIAAVLQGLLTVRPEEKVCFLVSGGSVGLSQLDQLKDVTL